MKKRLKLIFSAISICLAVAVLGFGVYAATAVNFSISSSVIYDVKNLFIDIDSSVSGGNLASAATYKFNSVAALGNPTTSALEWKGTTTSGNGVTVNGSIANLNFVASESGKTITFTFKFTNKGAKAVSGNVTTTYPTTFVNQTLSSSTVTLAAGANQTVTISYTLKSFGYTLSNEALSIKFNFSD